MINELKEIIDGWKNLVISNSATEELSIKRYKICLDCPSINRNNKRCKICNCYLPASVRAKNKKCPKGKW